MPKGMKEAAERLLKASKRLKAIGKVDIAIKVDVLLDDILINVYPRE